MAQKSLLITRPFYENPTNYLYYWSKPLIEFAQNKRFIVIDLAKEKAVRKEIEGRLKKVKPDLVILNGHGSEKEIFGQNGEILLVMGESEKLLADKIIYARACLSAKLFGKSCIKHGTKAYIGYQEDFIFIFDTTYTTEPLKDKITALFMEPSNQTVKSLLKGNSAKKSNENGKNAFFKNILKLLTSETRKEESDTIRYLVWDMKHQVCLGNPDAIV